MYNSGYKPLGNYWILNGTQCFSQPYAMGRRSGNQARQSHGQIYQSRIDPYCTGGGQSSGSGKPPGTGTQKEEFVFFYGPKNTFSQMHPAKFVIDGWEFSCMEQYMQWKKAVTFEDWDTAEQIMSATDPKQHKKLGRKVTPFFPGVWSGMSVKVVEDGNIQKYKQNPHMKKELFDTCPKTLVEASPRDRLWGIGMGKDNPNAKDRSKWRGRNLLGETLTKVRNILMKEEGYGNRSNTYSKESYTAEQLKESPRHSRKEGYSYSKNRDHNDGNKYTSGSSEQGKKFSSKHSDKDRHDHNRGSSDGSRHKESRKDDKSFRKDWDNRRDDHKKSDSHHDRKSSSKEGGHSVSLENKTYSDSQASSHRIEEKEKHKTETKSSRDVDGKSGRRTGIVSYGSGSGRKRQRIEETEDNKTHTKDGKDDSLRYNPSDDQATPEERQKTEDEQPPTKKKQKKINVQWKSPGSDASGPVKSGNKMANEAKEKPVSETGEEKRTEKAKTEEETISFDEHASEIFENNKTEDSSKKDMEKSMKGEAPVSATSSNRCVDSIKQENIVGSKKELQLKDSAKGGKSSEAEQGGKEPDIADVMQVAETISVHQNTNEDVCERDTSRESKETVNVKADVGHNV